MLLNSKIRSVYTPGLQIYLFIENFEGKFIEGDHLENIFDSYIGELEKLVKILRMSKIIRIIRTQDLILVNYNFEELTAQLKKNYDCLSKYWLESEELGIDDSEKLESYKKIEKLGWFEKIGHDTRDYYIGRLNKILGDRKKAIATVETVSQDGENGIILSWAVKRQGGHGHFNEQNNDYIKSKNGKIFINSDDVVLNEISKDIDKISYGLKGNTSAVIESDTSLLKINYKTLAN